MSDPIIHPASFRDPSGFIFHREGKLYRQVNTIYQSDYDHLIKSGLYKQLSDNQQLLTHEESDTPGATRMNWYKTLLPEVVPFITYPYEWCFEQFKDAALLTLAIVKTSIDHGMILKDATPFNIQFLRGKPVFIDTLSFEKYDESKPWVAYRQFCNLFLFPLYLEFYLHSDIQKMIVAYPEGIPVDITSKLLPLKSSLSLGVWLHVYLQNTVTVNSRNRQGHELFNRKKLLNLVGHLESTISNMHYRKGRSEWSDYYDETILGRDYLEAKEKIFLALVADCEEHVVLDLGANDGHFSKLLASMGKEVIAADADSRSISKLYTGIRRNNLHNILPVVIDAANPTPAIGFRNLERASFHQRVQAGLIVALALVHHLCIGRNISLSGLSQYLADHCKSLIIEWVPKEDEKVKLMMASRKDIFSDYTELVFEENFSRHFSIIRREMVPGTARVIYLMKKR